MNINASFSNNRNNGFSTAKAPQVVFESGYFVVYDGLGNVIPYSASETLYGTPSAAFTLGETVTQATSGATGVVVSQNLTGASKGITVNTITGTFVITDVVTGGTSASTIAPSSLLLNTEILGLSNDSINAASADWTDSDDLNVSTPVNIMDALDIPVSVGTPDISMVGSYVNVDPANPGAVDVTTVGTTGQILVTRITNSDAAPLGFIKGIIAKKVA